MLQDSSVSTFHDQNHYRFLMNKRKPFIHQALRNDKLVFVLVRGGLLDGHRGAIGCTNKGFVFEDNFET